MSFEINRPDEIFRESATLLQWGIAKKAPKGYTARTIKAGKMLEVQIFPTVTRTDYTKAKRKKPSVEEMRRVNERYSIRKFVRTVNANFTEKDIWATFEWDFDNMPENVNEARNRFKNFIDRLNRKRRKKGLEKAKYVYVIEEKEGKSEDLEPAMKYHIHVIMDGALERGEVEKTWIGGRYPYSRKLMPKDMGLTGLACYLVKGRSGIHRWGGSIGLKKWSEPPKDNRSKFSRKKVVSLITDTSFESWKPLLEKMYPGYSFNTKEATPEVYSSAQLGGCYIYLRMYKKN